MAFNPVKRVQRKLFETTLEADLQAGIRTIAAFPPAPETPYLTVSLDWRPSGANPEVRPDLHRFERETKRVQQEHWPRGLVFDSLGTDIERCRAFLQEDLDPAAKGVFIVANAGIEVFEAFALGMPLETGITSGPIPALLSIARLDEDYPPYAVLLADQQEATLSLIVQRHRIERLRLRSSDYPRKQQTGAWSQRRFQQRADERLLAMARQVASEAETWLSHREIDTLIIAGDEALASALDRVMEDGLRSRLIATIRLDSGAPEANIVRTTMPIAERAEAQREFDAATEVASLIGQQGLGIGGSIAVLNSLAAGQASKLVINDDFHDDAWADPSERLYKPRAHADEGTQGEDLIPIAVEQEMVRLAIMTDAEIDVIRAGVPMEHASCEPVRSAGEIPRTDAARIINSLGGVAAVLRYR